MAKVCYEIVQEELTSHTKALKEKIDQARTMKYDTSEDWQTGFDRGLCAAKYILDGKDEELAALTDE